MNKFTPTVTTWLGKPDSQALCHMMHTHFTEGTPEAQRKKGLAQGSR